MNKEYIERAAAVAFLENMAASRYLIQCFEDKEKFPAADVAPVRHGEWEWREFYGEPGLMLCCSNCGETEGANEKFEYCPNCGAYMNGGNS
jgi:hypothetical protein